MGVYLLVSICFVFVDRFIGLPYKFECPSGFCTYCALFFQVAFFMISGQRQARRIRLAYFRSVLSQEIGWFDSQASGSLSTRLAEDTFKIQDAISDKMGSAIQFGAMFLAGFVIGFMYGWKLTLVLLSVTPALAICG